MIKLKMGDCLEVLKNCPDGSVDMVLCDLPYGTTACKWDAIIPFDPMWEAYWRVLRPGGVVALFCSQPFTTNLIGSQLDKYRYSWIWDKVKPSGFQLAKYQPMRRTEEIAIFNSSRGNYNPQKVPRDKPVKSRVYSSSQVNPSTVDTTFSKTYADKNPQNILVYSNADNTNRVHPTQKPVPLLEYLIRTYTNEGETVLDNTMGSGSTGVACVNTGRSFIGIEKEPEYFEIAERRINEAQRLKGEAG